MRETDLSERRADAGAGTKAQRGLETLDRGVGVAGVQREHAADVPAAGVVWVERQGAVDQRYHGADVFAEIGQRLRGIRQDAWVVAGHFQRSPGKIDALPTMRLRVFAPTGSKQPETAKRS